MPFDPEVTTMNHDDRDRLELLLSDAARALREARAICRHALNGSPGEYDLLGRLGEAAGQVDAASDSLERTPGPVGESLRVR
jgi:hypothetical protein